MANELILNLEKSLYEREAVLACVQIFQSESDVRILRVEENMIAVAFTGTDRRRLEEVVKNFRIELVNQQVRRDLNAQFGNLREMIVAQAFLSVTAKK